MRRSKLHTAHNPGSWIFLGLLVLLGGLKVQGQQRMQYTQYLNNSFLVNPALTGVEAFFEGRAAYSHQWAGFGGAPRALLLSGHQGLFSRTLGDRFSTTSLPAPGRRAYPSTSKAIAAMNKPAYNAMHLGVGGSIYSEQTGPISYNGFSGSFAVHLPLNKEWVFSAGANLELLNYRLDPSKVALEDANDLAVAQSQVSLWLPSLNAGFALYRSNFFVGGSARQLLQNRVLLTNTNPVTSGLVVHYYVQAGYRLDVDGNWSLQPSVAYRRVKPAPPSMDFNLQANYNDVLWLGLGYRHQDAVIAQIGFSIQSMLRFGYSYDFTTSNLRNQSSGTHGLSLSLRLPTIGFGAGFDALKRRYFW